MVLSVRGGRGQHRPAPCGRLAAKWRWSARLADQLPGPFVAVDCRGRVVVWNSACRRLTGWTVAEVRADAGRLFPDPQDRARVAAEWDQHRRLPAYHDWAWRVRCKDGSSRTLSWTSCHVFSPFCSPPWGHWAIGRDVTDDTRRSAGDDGRSAPLLREVALGFAATSADDFFQQLVKHLINASGLDHAIVGEYHQGHPNFIRTIAACVDGQLVPNIEYHLEGTPCEDVLTQSPCTLREDVQHMYPNDYLLAKLGVEGYVGRPLFSLAGNVIGLMVLMSRTPIYDAERAEMVIDIFAGRASAEFERRQHEMAMKKSELLFRQVTDNIAPMVYVATPGFTQFHYVSAPFAHLWGHPPESLLQRPSLWLAGIHPDDRDQPCTRTSDSDAHVREFRVVHATLGSVKWVRDRGWKIFPTDDDPRVVGIVEDIVLERQALEHVETARKLAEEASTAKTLFLANISHELRTPLQGVLGMLELLDLTLLNTSQRENLLIAKRSADHMLFLINELLDVVRIEKGKLEICLAQFSLRDHLGYLMTSFAHTAELQNKNFESHLRSDLPDLVVGDKDRMAQVLNNIVGNAFKFTEPGGIITVTVSLDRQDLTQDLASSPTTPPADSNPATTGVRMDQHEQCVLLFEVADTGIGIPKDKMPHIFDAFYQVDPTHSKKYAGLGMGLKISSELIQYYPS